MNKESFINNFVQLGIKLRGWLSGDREWGELDRAVDISARENSFFTSYMQRNAIEAICLEFLQEERLRRWLSQYPAAERKRIGIVMAGNIPLVGFHDLLCTLASGSSAVVKLSSKDRWLLPAIFLSDGNAFSEDVKFVSSQEFERERLDALITMGGNSAAAFYIERFPNLTKLVRSSRFSIAILSGSESRQELDRLASDMLLYYGLGCRSVTYLFVPKNYDLSALDASIDNYYSKIESTAFRNNYLTNKSVYSIDSVSFHDTGSLLLVETSAVHLPIGCAGYGTYVDLSQIDEFIAAHKDEIQKKYINFGDAQRPLLEDYPDGADTMAFILDL